VYKPEARHGATVAAAAAGVAYVEWAGAGGPRAGKDDAAGVGNAGPTDGVASSVLHWLARV
jgi:hypothetical protein